jgi:PPP family 3-phenylpropionic acid transporter
MPIVLRLGLFYAAFFVGSGASLPFMPVWFRAQGLSATQMTVILALPMFARTLVGPAIGLWADSFRLRRTSLIWLGVAATAAFAAMALPWGYLWWLATWFVGYSALSCFSPLTDVITLRRTRIDGFAYALPRGIGSAGYVFGNVVMGLVLQHAPPVSVLVWTVTAAGLAAMGARALAPADPVREDGAPAPSHRELWAGLGGLLRDPLFMLAIGAIALLQASHGFYYSCSTLLWRRQGVPDGWIGLLWGFGVAAEVAFLWFAEPWRRRLGPERLLMIGGLGALARWSLLAFSPPLWLLFAAQGLHALSYMATFLASLRLIERLAPAEHATAAQSLNASLSGGVAIGLTTVISGPLFDAIGAGGYWVMAAITLVGLAGCWRALTLMRRRSLAPPQP